MAVLNGIEIAKEYFGLAVLNKTDPKLKILLQQLKDNDLFPQKKIVLKGGGEFFEEFLALIVCDGNLEDIESIEVDWTKLHMTFKWKSGAIELGEALLIPVEHENIVVLMTNPETHATIIIFREDEDEEEENQEITEQ